MSEKKFPKSDAEIKQEAFERNQEKKIPLFPNETIKYPTK